MKKIAVLNGPNLNLLGKREPDIYGKETLVDIIKEMEARIKEHAGGNPLGLLHFQSNHEGELIDFVHTLLDSEKEDIVGLIVNLGALSHSSIALYDALRVLEIPIVEVHLSNTAKREDFRHHSYVSPIAKGVIMGLGKWGYFAALNYLMQSIKSKH